MILLLSLSCNWNVQSSISPMLCLTLQPQPVESYIYCCSDIAGVLELKEETIESLLAAACLLQLSQVIQVCCNFLMKQLHPSNCLGIRSFADAQGCVDLLNVAHNYTMVGWRIELDHIYMAGWARLFYFLIRDCTLKSHSFLHEYTGAAVVMRAITVSWVLKN